MINETKDQIKARLLKQLKLTPPFNVPTLSPSAVALWANFLDTIATEIFTLEQLNNDLETEIEGTIKGVTTPTDAWWRKQILLFQYNSSNPQVVQIDQVNFAPYYPTINESYRIIQEAAVITDSNNIVQIKVSKGAINGYVLSNSEATALNAYISTIAPSGIQWQIINVLPDQLCLTGAIVYYNGQFSDVIKVNVIAAINNYLLNLPFNGIVKISSIEDAIQAVSGVTDVTIPLVSARAAGIGQTFANKTDFNRFWQTYSGQIIEETTAGHTFSDSASIQFVVANN